MCYWSELRDNNMKQLVAGLMDNLSPHISERHTNELLTDVNSALVNVSHVPSGDLPLMTHYTELYLSENCWELLSPAGHLLWSLATLRDSQVRAYVGRGLSQMACLVSKSIDAMNCDLQHCVSIVQWIEQFITSDHMNDSSLQVKGVYRLFVHSLCLSMVMKVDAIDQALLIDFDVVDSPNPSQGIVKAFGVCTDDRDNDMG